MKTRTLYGIFAFIAIVGLSLGAVRCYAEADAQRVREQAEHRKAVNSAREYLRLNGFSRKGLETQLVSEGYGEYVAYKAVKEAYEDISEVDMCIERIKKLKKSNPRITRMEIIQHLLILQFPEDVIKKISF